MADIIAPQAAAALLAELVRCPSVTPLAGPAGQGPYGEGRYAALLGDRLAALGASVEFREVEPGRPNLIARFDGPAGSPSVMFEAHSDTVAVDGMTVDPFAAEVRDGRLYGRGACDTKAAMAAMLLAVQSVLAADGGLRATVYVVSTCGEEITGLGAKALVGDGFFAGGRVDAAIVGEPTDLDIIHASKGSGRFHIETRGKAAHSSAPADGVNAIYQMAHIVAAIERDVAAALAAMADPVLGSPTVSVGTIRGGSQVNIVPDACTIDVDTRLIPGQTFQTMAALIHGVLDRSRAARGDLQYVIHNRPAYPAFFIDGDAPLPVLVARACREVLGRSTLRAAPWASNAGIFAEAGVPSVLVGPGSIAQAHTCDEFVEIDQVVQAAKLYAAIIRAYGGAGAPATGARGE
ncbi:MAG: M20 family metallopeptidase [Planctomycetes bacterium]|nr:M20 family metallopeptidase [Planctomycetota bacterium]